AIDSNCVAAASPPTAEASGQAAPDNLVDDGLLPPFLLLRNFCGKRSPGYSSPKAKHHIHMREKTVGQCAQRCRSTYGRPSPPATHHIGTRCHRDISPPAPRACAGSGEGWVLSHLSSGRLWRAGHDADGWDRDIRRACGSRSLGRVVRLERQYALDGCT